MFVVKSLVILSVFPFMQVFATKDGVSHGPAYYNGNADLRIGGIDHILRSWSSCGIADAIAHVRALKDVNFRDSRYCAAIDDLLPLSHANSWNMSLVDLDALEEKSAKAATQAGLKLMSQDGATTFSPWVGTTLSPWQDSQYCIDNGGNCPIKPVAGILGPSYSGTSMAVAATFETFDMPLLTSYAVGAALSVKSGNAGYPNFFRVVPPASYFAVALTIWLKDWNVTKVYSVTVNNGFARGQRDSIMTACNLQAITVIESSEYIPSNIPDQSDQVLDISLNDFRASGTRTMIINGVPADTKKLMVRMVAQGLMNGDEGYFIIHPDLVIGTASSHFDGVFALGPSHTLTSVWQSVYNISVPPVTKYTTDNDAGLFKNDPYIYTHLFQSKMCGVNQDLLCNDSSIGVNGKWSAAADALPMFAWDDVATDFGKCNMYSPFAYDAVVMYGVAYDVGVRLKMAGHVEGFDRDDVTPGKMMAVMKILSKGADAAGQPVLLDKDGTMTPVKQFYGTCLTASGGMAFEWDPLLNLYQEKKADHAVVNYRCATPGCNAPAAHNVVDLPAGGPNSGKAVLRQGQENSIKFGTGTKRGYPYIDGSGYITGMPPSCPAGQYLSFATGTCKNTDLGYYQPQANKDTQIPCAAGTYCASGGCTTCTACSPGQYQDAAGKDSCKPCGVGHAIDSSGAKVCALCLPGFYNPEVGQRVCRQCEKGKTQPLVGQSRCLPCPLGRTTLLLGSFLYRHCLCEVGSYENAPSSGPSSVASLATVSRTQTGAVTSYMDYSTINALPPCVACTKAISCPVGSALNGGLGATHELVGYTEVGDSDAIVAMMRPNMAVREGFYLNKLAEPLSDHTYACNSLGEKALSRSNYVSPCKGGAVGIRGCRENRQGLACGQCIADHFTTLDGDCKKCGGADGWAFIVCCLLLPLMLIGAYFVINGKMTQELSPIAMICISLGSLVTTMQSVAVLSSVSVSWPDSLAGLFGFAQVFAFDVTILRAECIMGNTVGGTFAFQIFFPYILGVLMLFFSQVSIKLFPKGDWRVMLRRETINTFGTFFQAAFISILLSLVQPFRTFTHPGTGGRKSMIVAPQITTEDAEYTTMLVFSFIGLLPIAGFVVLYINSVMKAPELSRSIGAGYARAIKFILFRFHPEAFWWGLPFLCRSVSIAMITILDPEKPFLQITMLIIVLTVYLIAQCMFWPWKTNGINVIDAFTSGCLIVMASSATAFVGEVDEIVQDQVSFFVIFFHVLILIAILVFVGKHTRIALIKACSAEKAAAEQMRRKARTQLLVEGLQRMSQHLVLTEHQDITNFVASVSDIDRNSIRKMLIMIAAELVPEEEKSTKALKAQSRSDDDGAVSRINSNTSRGSYRSVQNKMKETMVAGSAFGILHNSRRIRSNQEVALAVSSRKSSRMSQTALGRSQATEDKADGSDDGAAATI